jgi:type III secretion protein J
VTAVLRLQRWRACASVFACLLLVGCGRIDLYTNLSEQQANEVAAVLLAAEIDADKRVSESKAWAVRIVKSDLPRAMDVLESAGVPKMQSLSMAELFKKDGFISSPLEERARFISATATELQQTIGRMNGVLDARVHLAMPERDPLTDQVVPASASVFVKYTQDVKFAENGGVGNVKALVRDAVEGLSVDRITVVATPAAGSWRHAVRPSDTLLAGYAYQKPLLRDEFWLAFGLFMVLCLASALWLARARWLPRLLRRGRRSSPAVGGRAVGS